MQKCIPSQKLSFSDVVEVDAGISEELQKELDRDGIVIYEKPSGTKKQLK